jgi:hypothetical protein
MRWLFILWCCSASGASGPELFRFAVISDPHIGEVDKYISGEPAGNFAKVATFSPAFAILPGDLTKFASSNNFFSLSNQMATNWSFPAYCLTGNHDRNENNDESNPGYLWWNAMMLPSAQNTNGTNRHWSFSYQGMQFIGFETYNKTNAPDIGLGVVETNEAAYVVAEMQAATTAGKVPILITHYQIATNWSWGKNWYIAPSSPSDRYTLTNGMETYKPPFSLSGNAHATNNYGWCNNSTNISVASLRSIDQAGTVTNGVLTNGGFTIFRVYQDALVGELYLADHPTYTPLTTNEWPAAFPSQSRRRNVITLNVGTLILN